MNKLMEYRDISKDLRQKKAEMRAARAKITSYNKEYFLDKSEDFGISACINKFERVYGICMDPNAYEDGEFTKFCPLFGPELCADRKCPKYPENMDYIVARERYDMAVARRRQFIRELFNKKSK